MLETLLSLLIFFQPFERIPSVELFGLTVRISSFVLLVFWGYLLLKKRSMLKPVTKLDWVVLFFFGTGLFSVLFSESLTRSLTVILLWAFSLGAYLLVSHIVRQKGFAAIEKVLLNSMVVTSLFGLYQFIAGSFFDLSSRFTLLSPNYERDILGFARVQSVGVEPLYYASFLFLPLAILFVRIAIAKKYQLSDLLLFILGFTTLILTLSRGAYLGILASLIAMTLALILVKRAKIKGLILVCFCVIFSYGIFQGLVFGASLVEQESADDTKTFINHAFGGEETRSSSVNPRIDALKDAWEIYKTKPLTGVGIGNYGTVTTLQKTSENQQPIVNNQYLEVLTEMGPLGFVAFMAILFIALRSLILSIKKPETQLAAVALFGASVALGVQWNFFSTIYIVLIWILLGLINALSHEKA